MSTSGGSLRDAIFSLPVVDTHTHLWPYSKFPQPMTAYDFFEACGYIRAWWTTSGFFSPEDLRQGRKVMDWPTLSAGLASVRTVGFYRILLNGLKNLYNLDFDELDEGSLAELSDKLAEAYASPDWLRTVLKDKCGMDLICQDLPGEIDRSLLTPTARMDSYIMFGRKGQPDSILAKYGEERTSSLDGIESCLRQDFEEAARNGAAAIKSRIVWARSLDYEEVSKAEAEKALLLCRRNEDGQGAEKMLGDYMMARITELCAEFGLPLQIHTGPSGGTINTKYYGNPLELNSLIRRNPETKFDLLHAGGPYVSESCHLAQQFPNVYLNLCGIFGREWLRRILDEWIEFVPPGRMMWGTDVNLVEEAYAATLNFRQVLAEFLEDRVRSGYLSTVSAEEFALGILGENARQVLRLHSARNTG